MAIGITAMISNHLRSLIYLEYWIYFPTLDTRLINFGKTEAVSLAAIKRQIYTHTPPWLKKNSWVKIIVSSPLSFNQVFPGKEDLKGRKQTFPPAHYYISTISICLNKEEINSTLELCHRVSAPAKGTVCY